MLESVNLLTVDSVVAAPEGIIYSTQPRTAVGENGVDYFIKGPEPEVAFAELAGCLLAASVGVTVPPVAVCHFGGTRYCGSCKAADLARNIEPFLSNPAQVTNFNEAYSIIVVDAWLANKDRNFYNIIGRTQGRGRVEFVMIDFEKSCALRPAPIISSTMVNPKDLWPSGVLGDMLKRQKPLHPPSTMVTRIRSMTRDEIAEIIEDVSAAFQPVDWSSNSVDVLVRRATEIAGIAEATWAQA